MFGIWPRRKTQVFHHWYALVPDFQMSTHEFYQAVEEALIEKEVPGLEISRVEFPEGDILSSRRTYLRLRRERLLFDVCSAPFGTSWFCSCRFAQIPVTLRLWELVVILGLLGGFYFLYAAVFGMFWGMIVYGLTLLGILYLLNHLQAMGLYGLDAVLIKTPVLGAFYEVFFRRNTYFREDSRLMYCDLVDQIVKAKVVEFTGAGNVVKVDFKTDPAPPATTFLDHLRAIWVELSRKPTSGS